MARGPGVVGWMSDEKEPKKVIADTKARASTAIIAQLASQIAAGLAHHEMFYKGRNLDEDALAGAAVTVAKKILVKASE